jgi:hypothetical protein
MLFVGFGRSRNADLRQFQPFPVTHIFGDHIPQLQQQILLQDFDVANRRQEIWQAETSINFYYSIYPHMSS